MKLTVFMREVSYERLFVAILFAGALFCFSAATVAHATNFQVDTDGTLTTNLVSYWKLEDATDSYGGNDLTATGTVSYVSAKVNNGASMATGGNYLKIANSPSALNFDGTQAFSLAFWVNVSSTGVNETIGPSLIDDDNKRGPYWVQLNTTGNIVLRMANASNNRIAKTGDLNFVTSTNTWYFIAVTYDGGKTAAGYKAYYGNATSVPELSFSVNQDTLSGTTETTGVDFRIGKDHSGVFDFGGTQDEIGTWSKVLSSQELADLWNSGSGNTLEEVSEPSVTTSTLQQYQSDATTTISLGGTVDGDTVVFGGTVNASGTVRLQVEVWPAGTSFINASTTSSGLYSSGSYATTSQQLSHGSYHWQVRALDSSGQASSWTPFSTTSSVDFIVSTPVYEISDGSVVGLFHLEDADDSSGNGYDLTAGSSTFFELGFLSSVVHVTNSATGYLSASSSTFNFGSTDTWSTSCWVRADDTATHSSLLSHHDDTAVPGGYWIGYGNNDVILRMKYSGSDRIARTSTGYTMPSSTWVHLVTTYDGSKSASGFIAYADNTQLSFINNKDTLTQDVANGHEFRVGRDYGGLANFGGYLDECVLFNTVMSTSTIAGLYNDGVGAEVCTTAGCSPLELSGTISSSTTWGYAGAPYVVTSTVTIATGTTVTVEPGVIVKFKDDTDLIVNGTLDVQGTSSSLVYFTSFKDDGIGGDTNGNGTSTGAAGDWGQISINSGASSTLAGVVVRYGGSNTDSDANIYNNGGTLTVRYADISNSSDNGLRIDSGTTTITWTAIHDNPVGIDIVSGQATVASSTIFVTNATTTPAFRHGASQAGAPTSTMTGNFWGGWMPLDWASSTYNSGPYNTSTNPSGGGDTASSYIDFEPYVTAYLSHPAAPEWSPPGVFTATSSYVMRVGSSTQYQAQLNAGRATWNASSSGYVTIENASSSPSSDWDIYVADTDAGTSSWAGWWIPSTTSTSHILFNTDGMGDDSDANQCVTTHELGHALGLAHSTGTNMMVNEPCTASKTTLGTQDVDDFNLLWGPVYFFDPHMMKGIIQW